MSIEAGGNSPTPSISPTSSTCTSMSGTESTSPDFMSLSHLSIVPSSSVGGDKMNIVAGNQRELQNQKFFAVQQNHRHQLSTGNFTRTRMNLANTSIQQQQNEISKSLKRFAMLTAYSNENGKMFEIMFNKCCKYIVLNAFLGNASNS